MSKTNKYVMALDDLPEEIDQLNPTVCIVGSGPAGSTAAIEVAKNGFDVLLIEAGDYDVDSDFEKTIDQIDVSPFRKDKTSLKFGFSRQIGGSSNLWAGRTALFENIDLQERDWLCDGDSWPFDRSTLDQHYANAVKFLGLPDFDGYLKADIDVPLSLGQKIDLKCFQWSKKPFNFKKTLLEASKNEQSNFSILYNACVQEVILDASGKNAECITVKSVSGREIKVSATIFVLAAGGVETPRILLNSKSHPLHKNGIGNNEDVVGRYLSTHPKSNMAALILKKSVPTQHPLFNNEISDKASIRYGLGFNSVTQQNANLLNHYVQLSPLLEHNANKMFEMIKGTKAVNSELLDRSKLIKGILPGLGLLVFETFERIAGLQKRAKKFILRAFLDQHPSPENRVYLSEEKDVLGVPKASVYWRFSEDDKKSVIDFFALLDEEVRSQGIGHIEYSKLRGVSDWPMTEIHSHFMGTTRMGSDPKTSVTNQDARIHGINNLYIAGPSLFPTYGFANPFLTIVALSLKLSEYIVHVLKTSDPMESANNDG